MAEGVVVLLEAVEVEEEQRARGAARVESSSWSSRSIRRLRRFFSPVSESVRASMWVWASVRWFSRNASAIRASASSSAHAARLTATAFTRSKWSYTSSSTATSPHPAGTATTSQS